MIKQYCQILVVAWLCASPGMAAEKTPLGERPFQERIQRIRQERLPAEKLRLAREMLGSHLFSSQQVKHILTQFEDDNDRIEFAVAAYPNIVDPENFYDVYDAFVTFSKVMRLHDRIQPMRRNGLGSVVGAPRPVTEPELADMLQALRKEPFDDNRTQLARQILSGRPGAFLTSQIKQILGCFNFESTRLELAKFAYDYTLDREKYFTLNEAFSFPNSRQELSQYIESKRRSLPPPR